MTIGPYPSFRSLLQTLASPQSAPDYLVRLEGNAGWKSVRLVVRYIPDRLIIQEKAWEEYVTMLGSVAWETVEELVLHILNDLNNEIVPRWVQVAGAVRIFSESSEDEASYHRVLVEDHQPTWGNVALIDRLSG